MSVRTDPAFIYGIEVTRLNNIIDFKESSIFNPALSFQVPIGNYCLDELAKLVEDGFNQAGSLNCYQVLVDKYTRKMTIKAEDQFQLLVSTGDNSSQSLLTSLGFIYQPVYGGGSVDTDNVYSSFEYGDPLLYGTTDSEMFPLHRANGCIGSEYRPQFCVQDFRDADNNCALRNPSINESVNGECVEVISYGVDQFYDFNFRYITDKPMDCGAPIRNNPDAVKEINDFMKWAITRKVIEYFPDRCKRDVSYKIRLTRTTGSSNGTGYSLTELVRSGLPCFFDTGRMTFRRSNI